jgi:hypothetical protein
MREQGPTKVEMKAIDPQKNLAPQKNSKSAWAYESLNPALKVLL